MGELYTFCICGASDHGVQLYTLIRYDDLIEIGFVHHRLFRDIRFMKWYSTPKIIVFFKYKLQ